MLATALAWPACGRAGGDAAARFTPGQPVVLRPGETAVSADGSWRIGFDTVTSDSRCPRGERCVWAGEATVSAWVQAGTGPRRLVELRSSGTGASAAGVGQALRLLRLEPYPVSGRQVAPGAYTATLLLAPAASAAPER